MISSPAGKRDGTALSLTGAAAMQNRKLLSFFSFTDSDFTNASSTTPNLVHDAFDNTEIAVLVDKNLDGVIKVGSDYCRSARSQRPRARRGGLPGHRRARRGDILRTGSRRGHHESPIYLQLEMKSSSNCGHRKVGFTLLELLVVVGLIATLSFFLIGGLRGGGRAAAMQSAQATLANLVTAARTKAAASGCRVRILICADPADLARFRRTLAVQQESTLNSNTWNAPAFITSLPDGVFVLPYRGRIPAGFYDSQSSWVKYNSTNPLESSSLSGSPVSVALEGNPANSWDLIQFTPAGTLSTGVGDVVLASGAQRPPGSYLAGESPVQVTNPENIRGISISTYGVPALINSRASF